ncbi:hypothetical protein ENUP19_0160G0007 [Entamoeba nuttalli]|uniref:TLDc domain-containing protein n=1 Tax=Entamoeba nuttalli TaxID=412467 RepID=A0ABQ0DLI5_9EUKA
MNQYYIDEQCSANDLIPEINRVLLESFKAVILMLHKENIDDPFVKFLFPHNKPVIRHDTEYAISEDKQPNGGITNENINDHIKEEPPEKKNELSTKDDGKDFFDGLDNRKEDDEVVKDEVVEDIFDESAMKNSHKLGDVFYQYELDNHKNDILKFNKPTTINDFNKNNSLAIFIHIKDSNSVYGGIIHGDKSVLFCKEKNKKVQQIKSKGKITKGFIKAFRYDTSPDADILFKFYEAFAVAKTKGSDELYLHFEKSSDCYEGYSNFTILEDQNTIQRITAYNLDFFIYSFIY